MQTRSSRSLQHQQVQLYIRKALTPSECRLEHPFPEIGRIADAVWERHKLIFEVQRSPISIEEVATRNKDYASLGYTVVWILHDHLYGRRRLTPVEIYLLSWPHYFTNIDEQGLGFCYDMTSFISGKRRKQRTPPFPIDLAAPLFAPHKQFPRHFPKALRKRKWPLHFEGDLLSADLDPLFPKSRLWKAVANICRTYYRALLHYLLRKVCS